MPPERGGSDGTAVEGTEVLILAPFGRDAPLLVTLLADAGLAPRLCADADELRAGIRDGAAAAVVAEEALPDAARSRISSALAAEPAWSDFPILLLTSADRAEERLGRRLTRGLEGTGHVILLERPLRKATLLSAVRVALRSRQRQYEVRDELAARDRAEAALRESERRFRSTADDLPLLVWMHDRTGRQEFVNRTFCEFFGVRREEMRGRKWKALVHPDEVEAYEASFLAAVRDRSPFHLETRVRRADGEWRWLESWARPRITADGSYRGHLGISADVTERRRAEQALRRLNEILEERVAERTAVAERRARDLRRLATELTDAEHRERRRLAGILHDGLQQYLVAARLSLADLLRAPDEARERQAERLDELIEACLETSGDLAGELSPPVLHLGTFGEAIEWLGAWYEEKHGLAVAVRLPDPMPRLPEPIRLVLFTGIRELLLNVVKHSGRMEARVELRHGDGELAVRVEDEGTEFSPEAVEAKLRRPRSFGLFNVRERIEALGGRLEIRAAHGGGASFEMRVPVPPETAESRVRAGTAGAVPTSPPPGVLRVLIADDHEIVRQGFVRLLNGQDDMTVVGEAGDGDEAITLVEALRPDVVVMDVSMPGTDGIEATRRIRQRHPDTVVIGLSLHEQAAVERAMRGAGADLHMNKRASGRELTDAIRLAYEARRS